MLSVAGDTPNQSSTRCIVHRHQTSDMSSPAHLRRHHAEVVGVSPTPDPYCVLLPEDVSAVPLDGRLANSTLWHLGLPARSIRSSPLPGWPDWPSPRTGSR